MINHIPQIDAAELARRLADGVPLVDVREPDEFADGHVSGAVHLPLSQWPAAAVKVPGGKIHVICARGARSQRAAEYLAEIGHDVVNVEGGMVQWTGRGFPIETGGAPSIGA